MDKYFEYKGIEYKLLLLSPSGSRLYGSSFEKGEYEVNKEYESDHDYKGIMIANIKNKLEFEKPLQEIQYQDYEKDKDERIKFNKLLNETYNLNLKEDADIVLFEIEKFFNLINNNNPNSLDILFVNKKNMLYFDNEISKLYQNRNKLLTQKVFKSFYEYGKSQLYKINSGKKWINKFPKIENFRLLLTDLYQQDIISSKFIEEHFSKNLLLNIDNQFYKKKVKAIDNFEDFEYYCKNNINYNNVIINNILNKYDILFEDIKIYRKPFITDFLNVADLKNTTFNIQKNMNIFNKKYENITIFEFLKSKATFRKKSESIYFIYDTPNGNDYGIFTKHKDLKGNDNSEIGEFQFLLSVDRSNYKKQLSIIEDLWKWKTERNEKRNILESKFGYDVKHASHLYRLMKKSTEIVKTGKYIPELSKEDIIIIKDILNGKYKYEEIIQKVEDFNQIIENTTNNLPEEIEIKLLNELLLKIHLGQNIKDINLENILKNKINNNYSENINFAF